MSSFVFWLAVSFVCGAAFGLGATLWSGCLVSPHNEDLPFSRDMTGPEPSADGDWDCSDRDEREYDKDFHSGL
jgi:hypothetical protein